MKAVTLVEEGTALNIWTAEAEKILAEEISVAEGEVLTLARFAAEL